MNTTEMKIMGCTTLAEVDELESQILAFKRLTDEGLYKLQVALDKRRKYIAERNERLRELAAAQARSKKRATK